MTERTNLRNAVGWSFVMNGGQYFVNTLVAFLLARLLGPEVFGLVAMALAYVTLLHLLMQQGMVSAVVQREDLQPEDIDSAFWLVVGAGIGLVGVSISLSTWWAGVNDLPQLAPVINALTLMIPLKSLSIVQEALLQRNMDFKALAVRMNAAVIAGGLIGLISALLGVGVWALVLQQLTTAAVGLIVLWIMSPWRPSLRFSSASASQLVRFSSGSSFASIAVFAQNRGDALLVGLFFGPVAVGLYRFASRIVDIVLDVTVRSLQSVSLPELSRMQTSRSELSKRLKALIAFAATVSFPLLAVLAATSDTLMSVLGAEWSSAAGPLRVLCILSAIRAVTMFNGPLLQAIGRPHLLAGLAWLTGIASAIALVLAAVVFRDADTGQQVVGIAWMQTLVLGGTILAINSSVLRRFVGLSPIEQGTQLRTGIAAGIAALAAALALRGIMTMALPEIAQFATAAAAGVAAAIAVVLMIDEQARTFALAARRKIAGEYSRKRWTKSALAADEAAQTRTDRREGV